MLGVLCCLCGLLGHLAPVQQCALSASCVACAVSWATWLLLTGLHARGVVLCVGCPGPLGSCLPVCTLGVLCCMCVDLGHLAPVHRCARWMCCAVCAVSWATWLLFTDVYARPVVLHVWRPGPRGSCSPVFTLGVLCCVWAILGHLASVHCWARQVCYAVCAVSWAAWLLFTGVPARCIVLYARYPGTLGSCSLVCPLGVLCCVCGILRHLAPVHRCVRSACSVACAVSWATWLLFTGVHARRVVLRVRPVLSHLALVRRCVCSVFCAICALSWAGWLLFAGVPARCVVLCVRCPAPLGSCSPVCTLGLLCWVCVLLRHLAPVHRCAHAACCVWCAVSWATWPQFTNAYPRRVALRVRRHGPLGSCSPLCTRRVLCCVCGLLGHLAPVHRCARSGVVRCVRCSGPLGFFSLVCLLGVLFCMCGVLENLAPVQECACSLYCAVCAVFWATWLLVTGVPARCDVLCVCCPGPLGSLSTVCTLGVLCGVCGVLGHLAPVHRCACAVFCVVCAVSSAAELLFTGVCVRHVVFCLRCPGPLSSCAAVCTRGRVELHLRCLGPLGPCSPVCTHGLLCCMCGVLGHMAPAHQCLGSACCVAYGASWATWLLFTVGPGRCVVLYVRCPGPLGSCSTLCPLGVLSCICGFLGRMTPVHWCARSVCCAVCVVFWATWFLFTGVYAGHVVLRVRGPGPLGSCSAVGMLGVWCCVCADLGFLAPVHRCAFSLCTAVCGVSLAT